MTQEFDELLEKQIAALEKHIGDMSIEELRFSLVQTVLGFGNLMTRIATAHYKCEEAGEQMLALETKLDKPVAKQLVVKMSEILKVIAESIDVKSMMDEPTFLKELGEYE